MVFFLNQFRKDIESRVRKEVLNKTRDYIYFLDDESPEIREIAQDLKNEYDHKLKSLLEQYYDNATEDTQFSDIFDSLIEDNKELVEHMFPYYKFVFDGGDYDKIKTNLVQYNQDEIMVFVNTKICKFDRK